MTPVRSDHRTTLAWPALLLAGFLAAVSPLHAQEEPAPDARALLDGMTDFLSGLPGFAVDIQAGFDVVQEDGQKIEFVEARRIELDRPARLKVTERSAVAHSQSLLFDGETMTVWSPAEGVFAQAPQPDTVDDGLRYFLVDLQMRLPMAALLATWVGEELDRRLLSLAYVERSHAFGRPAHHLAARTVDLDFQVWIAEGPEPVPLRAVITYPEPGLPQYRAQFIEWNLAPEFPEGTFQFDPGPDMRQIAFAVQVPPLEEALQHASGDNP